MRACRRAPLLPLAAGVVAVGVAAGSARGQQPVQPAGEVTLSLGVLEGAPEETFHRVGEPFVLDDGRLVVPDGGSREIRLYTAEGGWIRSLGRQGDGPGEFRQLDGVWSYRGDSLAVFDARLQRLTVMDLTGEVGRTLPLSGGATSGPVRGTTGPARRSFVEGVFDDGSFLARRGETSVGPGDTTRVARDTFPHVHLGPGGEELETVARIPDDEHFVYAERGSRSVRATAFGRTTAVEVAGAQVYVADNRAFRVRVLRPDGAPIRTFVAPRRPLPVRPEDAERWRRQRLDALTQTFLRDVAEAAIRATPVPDTLPVHGRMLVGRDGRVWLEEITGPDAFLAPGHERHAVWTVFAADGTPSARVRFPPGFRLTDAGPGSALGVRVDALGVERVQRLRLPPSAGGP